MKEHWIPYNLYQLNKYPPTPPLPINCFVCGIELYPYKYSPPKNDCRPKMDFHHISYKREITIDVCRSCHLTIHRTNKYPEIIPSDNRRLDDGGK